MPALLLFESLLVGSDVLLAKRSVYLCSWRRWFIGVFRIRALNAQWNALKVDTRPAWQR